MNESETRRNLTLHPSIGRRYEHPDLTAHAHKNRRRRRLAFLLESSLQAMVAHYARELGAAPDQFAGFAHEVGRRLRAEVRPEWTRAQAEARALALAEQLFEELGGDETRRPEDDSGDAG